MTELMYDKYAKYYDLIYSWKNYKKEADKICKLILQNKESKGNDLLEAGCGTAHHLSYLRGRFNCTGIDINPGMVRIAKSKIKNTRFMQADMISMNLNKKFDVVISLFSSIGYVKTYPNLKKTLLNFSRHLKPGGVAIIEPWFTKSAYKTGYPHLTVYDGKDIKIARANVSKKLSGGISVLDFHFIVAEKGKDVKHFVDRHEIGLFDTGKTLLFMREAGLKSKFIKNGISDERGLYVGVKK